MNEKQLRAFEKHLLKFGDEQRSEEKPFVSIFDMTSTESFFKQQKEKLSSLLKSVIPENLDEEDEDDTKDTIDDRETPTKQKTEIVTKDALAQTGEGGEEATFPGDSDNDIDFEEEIEESEEEISEIEEELEQEIEEEIEGPVAFGLPSEYKDFKDYLLPSVDDVFRPLLKHTAISDIVLAGTDNLKIDEDIDEKILEDDYDFFEQKKAQEAEKDLTEDDKKLFLSNLDSYNVFIKKTIIHILTTNELSEECRKLIRLVINGARARSVLHECEKILNIELNVPSDWVIYTNKSLKTKLLGAAEIIQMTVYFVGVSVFPIVASITVIFFISFYFIVEPVRALIQYRSGYEALIGENYEKSEKCFVRASSIWHMQKYYFKYANEYITQKKYGEAQKKYEQLLFGLDNTLRKYVKESVLNKKYSSLHYVGGQYRQLNTFVNFSRKGFNRLVSLERDVFLNFDTVERYQGFWIIKFPSDKKMYMSIGDTYVQWYDINKEKYLLDKALENYSKAIIISNSSDESLLRRVRYAVRVGEEEYLNKIQRVLLMPKEKADIDIVFNPYMELVEYRINKGQANYVAELLDKIRVTHPDYSEIPYLYALYYGMIGDSNKYKQSLLEAKQRYASETLYGKKYIRAINVNILLAKYMLDQEVNIKAANNILYTAEKQYTDIKRISRLKDISVIEMRIYLLKTKIELLNNNVNRAQVYLSKIVDTENKDADTIGYYQGLIYYLSRDFSKASKLFVSFINKKTEELSFDNIKEFKSAIVDVDSDVYSYVYPRNSIINTPLKNKEDIFLVTGNALHLAENYAVSAVMYQKAIESIRDSNIEEIGRKDIQYKTSLYRLSQLLITVKNNLGVSLYYLSQTKNNSDESNNLLEESLKNLRDANTMVQNLYRDSNESTRLFRVDLPEQNISQILNNKDNLSIYSDIGFLFKEL